ncbi:hypothetical protein [Viscerimonas tarda]
MKLNYIRQIMGNTLKFILDPANFDGAALASMSDGIHSDYGGETPEELRIRENNPALQALSLEEQIPVIERYEQSLCKPFEEITEERYWDLLECVPPKRFDGNRFFVGECYYGNLYRFCFRLNGKYYSALRSIILTDKEIEEQIREFEKSVKTA